MIFVKWVLRLLPKRIRVDILTRLVVEPAIEGCPSEFVQYLLDKMDEKYDKDPTL